MSQQNQVLFPISFGDDNGNDSPHYRGIQVANRNVSENMFGGARVMQKGSLASSEFGIEQSNDGNKTLFSSVKYPTQIITLELDETPVQQSPVQQQMEQRQFSETQTLFTNDISSFAVPNQTCEQVLNGLTNVLIDYSVTRDMDISIDNDRNCINGIVFMENNYGIRFRINIWKQDTNTSRFELLRTEGDAMTTAKFLGDVKTKFFAEDIQDSDNGSDSMNFVCLGFDNSGLDLNDLFDNIDADMKMSDNSGLKEELDQITQTLIVNDMTSIDELQYLYERLCDENDAIGMEIMEHKKLMNTIMTQTVNNRDICVVRGCLLVLNKLSQKYNVLLCEKHSLIEHLSQLLHHKSGLIKNYSVKLLHDSVKNEWNSQDGKNVKDLLCKYENEWKNSILKTNALIDDHMFTEIYQKIAEM